jgi:hypothetical protein
MKLFSVNSEATEVLDWINDQIKDLFPGFPLIDCFKWHKFESGTGKRDRWAGAWCNGTISLNPEFITSAGDEKKQSLRIQDILFHEICHHIQYEQFPHAVSHGKEFRKIAYYINGSLGREAVSIYHDYAKTPEGEEANRAQRKALALLARTNSSNEHEAALAAAKYAQFVAVNNISLDSHAQSLANGLPLMVKEHIWTSKNMSHWLEILLSVVAYTNSCSWTYIRSRGCTKTHFYGRPHKICQSYDLLDYLTEAVDRVVKKSQKESEVPMGKSYWSAFREGVAKRVAESLRADHSRRMNEGIVAKNGINHVPGLVLKSSFEKEIVASREFLHEIHARLGKSAARGSSSASGLSHGFAAGASISVARQTSGSSQKLLRAC